MKKLLLMAAAIGLAAIPSINAREYVRLNGNLTPVANFENGKKYLIYDASKVKKSADTDRTAFRYVSTDNEIWGNHSLTPASTGAVLDESYTWIASGDETNGFSFKNVGTELYIPEGNNYSTGSNPNMKASDSEAKFSILQTESDGNYHIIGVDDTKVWDGRPGEQFRMTAWSKSDDNYSDNHWYQFFEVTEDMMTTGYSVTIIWKTHEGQVIETHKEILEAADYPAGTVITAPSEVATGSLTVGDDAVAEFILNENYTPFKLVSARYRNRWAVSNGTGVTTTDGNNASAGHWFVKVPAGDNYKFLCLGDLLDVNPDVKYVGAIVNSGNPTPLVNSDNANTFRIVRHESGANYIYNAIGATGNAFNMRDNNVAGWNSVDVGSRFFMVADAEAYEANKASYYGTITGDMDNNYVTPYKTAIDEGNAAYNEYRDITLDEAFETAKTQLKNALDVAAVVDFGRDDVPAALAALSSAINNISSYAIIAEYSSIKAKGDKLVELGLIPDNAKSAWQSASSIEDFSTITETDVEAINNAYMTLTRSCDGVSVTFRHAVDSNDYVGILNGELKRAATVTAGRVFTFEAAENGFYVKNVMTGKYVKHTTTMGVNLQLVEGTDEASVYSIEIYDVTTGSVGMRSATFGTNSNGVKMEYWHSNGDNRLIPWAIGDNSAWLVTVMSAQEAEEVLLNDAKVLYADKVGYQYGVAEDVHVPGYANATEEVISALGQAIATKENLSQAINAVNSASLNVNYETTDGAIYTLRSTELNARGYLRHSNGLMANTKAPAATDFDGENPDFHFVFVTIDGVKYLYNIGAGKFMNAFGEKTDNTWPAIQNGADYTWRFSDVPTQIRQLVLFTSNVAHSFTISAGLTPTNNSSYTEGQVHEGGLSMTDSGDRPNIVSMGITHRTDGNGLIAECVGMMSADELAAVVAKATEALNDVTAQVNAIPEITEESHIVNHYSVLAAAAINAADAADHQHYLMETGERQAPVVGTAYTLVNENGNAWFVTSLGGVTTSPISKMDADNEAHYQWILTVNEPAVTEPEETETEAVALADSAAPTYTFSHTHDGNKINLTIDGVTEHELGTETLGKVNIAGTNYVIASTTGDATTAISEIGVNSPAAAVYYDLQGRRVAAPVKGGIYVTGNGKKVIF